jgi:hypothetical protein
MHMMIPPPGGILILADGDGPRQRHGGMAGVGFSFFRGTVMSTKTAETGPGKRDRAKG